MQRCFWLMLFAVGNAQVFAQDANSLLPLALGNSWTYEATRTTADGTNKRTFSVTNRVYAVRLLEENGDWNEWYHVRDFEIHFWGRWAKDELLEGVVSYHEEDYRDDIKDGESSDVLPTISEIHPFLKTACPLGTRWTLYEAEEGETPTTMELFSKDRPVKAEAGEFTCHQYRMRYEGGFDDYFFAPGVGIVKFTVSDDGERTTYLLKSYQLKK